MTSPLIDATELQRLLRDGGPAALLDVRWELSTGPDRVAFERGHLPGAVFVDLDRDLAAPARAAASGGAAGAARAPAGGGRHPLPEPAAFTESMRTAGVGAARPVVVYDAASSMAAARAWWLLRYFGHPAVRVLDGGLAGWIAAGGAVDTGPRMARRGDFAARPGAMPVLDAAGAAALARTGILIDARAAERFRGEQEPVDPVAGHIPGARNRPTGLNLTASARFHDPAALREAFERAGVRAGMPVGAYCGSGITAAHEVLALELAGVRAALYPGSWSEWITDPSRPVATGP